MTKFKILLHPDQKLKKVCKPVLEVTEDLNELSTKMLTTMYNASGIGLAAPQVGILRRIFVMDCSDDENKPDPLILINPEVLWVSQEKNVHEEGCLSIPEIYAEVERPAEVSIKSLDQYGCYKEYHFRGIKATCAQHEIDHLNGVLFIDYLGPLRRQVITSKMKKLKREKARSAI